MEALRQEQEHVGLVFFSGESFLKKREHPTHNTTRRICLSVITPQRPPLLALSFYRALTPSPAFAAAAAVPAPKRFSLSTSPPTQTYGYVRGRYFPPT